MNIATELRAMRAYAESDLRREGWTKRDALAVLDIAADCAEAEGK